MLLSMLLACAVASAGQYQYPSSQATLPPSGGPAPVYYTPAPTTVSVAPTVLISAPPLWDRWLARAGACLSSPGGAAPAPPGGHAVRRSPEAGHDLLRGRARARRGSPGVEPGTRVARRDRGGTAAAGPAVHPTAASSDVHPTATGQPHPRAEAVRNPQTPAGTVTWKVGGRKTEDGG